MVKVTYVTQSFHKKKLVLTGSLKVTLETNLDWVTKSDLGHQK